MKSLYFSLVKLSTIKFAVIFMAVVQIFHPVLVFGQTTTSVTTTTILKSNNQQSRVKVAVIENASQADFESKYLPAWKLELDACKTCIVENLTPYNSKGEFDPKAVVNVLSQLKDYQIVYIGWNLAINSAPNGLQKALTDLIAKGFIVIGRAGTAPAEDVVLPLSSTLLAQIPDLIIVGDLVEKERLYPRSYFGPEMLTAISTLKNDEVRDIGAILFTAKLMTNYQRKDVTSWMTHFKSVKAKSRKLWPTLNEIF